MEYIFLIIKIFLLFTLADLSTGVVHFWVDQFGREDTPLIGNNIVRINIEHHLHPDKMSQESYRILIKGSMVLVGILFLNWFLIFGFLCWEILFFGMVALAGNLTHKWSHLSEKENGKIISTLQRMKIIPSRHNHNHHHKSPHDTYYCVMTVYLNPILDRIKFWNFGIWFFKILGMKPIAGSEERDFV